MMRSFAVALVTIAAVAVLVSSEDLAALTQPTPPAGSFSYPVDVVGGTPGVNIEVFLNGGKLQDAAVGGGGDASWVLDLSNVGKTRVTVYVDVCQDGKVIKVAFVTGTGQAPPDDENCNRRIGGVGWTSDCGVTRITINIRTWGARVTGCTPFYQRPPFLGAAAALVVVPFVVGGGGDGPTAIGTPFVPQQPTVVTPPVTVTPGPTNNTPPSQPAFDFSLTNLITNVEHTSPGVFSEGCGRFGTNPFQANAPFVVQTSGPGVVQPSVTGNTNAAGVGVFRVRINSFGPYTFNVSVTVNSVTRTISGNLNVTSANGSCPSS